MSIKKLLIAILSIVIVSPASADAARMSEQEWRHLIDLEYETLETLGGQARNFPAICLHAHQAVEYLMKGMLDQQNVSYGITSHRTARLADMLSLHFPELKEAVNDFRNFDKLYDMATGPVRERYNVTQLHARTCIEIAQMVRELSGN